MKTLFEIKQALQTIGQQFQNKSTELINASVDVTKSMDDIKALENEKADLQKRLDVLQAQHDQMESEQQAELKRKQQQAQQSLGGSNDPKAEKVKAQAELIRSTMQQRPVAAEVFAALGDKNSTGGEKLLPKTLS